MQARWPKRGVTEPSDVCPLGWSTSLGRAADTIGTLHFARFVLLGETALAFVSEYDGELRDYIMDFTEHLGRVCRHRVRTRRGPASDAVAKNAEALIEWVKAHNLDPLALYCAYPSLSVCDIKALTRTLSLHSWQR